MSKSNNNKTANTYDVRISIDTLFLTSKLDDYQREYIYDRFTFNKNARKYHWKYSQLGTKSLGFSLHALPTNSYTYKNFDHCLMLQKEVTTADYIPYSLNEILHNIDWNIKRIDPAFDFKTPTEKSIIFKHHGNVQFDTNDTWETIYLGKLTSRSESKVAHYNRNIKEAERGTGVEHEYFNRYEVRLFPSCTDETMKLHNFDDDFILKHLSKYIIIPNIDDLPISQWDKNRLYKIKNDNTYTYFKSLDNKKQKELKEVTKAHRVPLEKIYLDSKHNLFNFLEINQEEQLETSSEGLILIDGFVPFEIYNDVESFLFT